ncbi:MAG: phosphatidylserine decarboxylase family protein [Bacteroidetes bacterium]|nr:MAG: phosphatidylserine decarboxylase family protein [Bacteroidota bacterium]REK00345.1 MAG: phosphatidylserine decarboxylase family protein [Bacteroidota bacterium]REK35464.1 MAG: phosphatidylserine decarboxylase family protein [Bacteroidota bacterium]REK46852.1 MAG: phosphatidylserine decarboxylase family protein [Bacteroidota bacterium]
MTIHKEGYASLILTVLLLTAVHFLSQYLLESYPIARQIILIISIALFLIVLQFFRHPKRNLTQGDKLVIAPADGKVVVIEETEENEVFKDRRLQVSIFMSPVNVHVNRYPVEGKVSFSKYHPGLYLVAWHPKSSTENERTTVVVDKPSGVRVLMRQIAGALARRIVCYATEGKEVKQGEEMGFIKFGSRVDVFLPIGTKVNVELNQAVKGGVTVLAELN